MSVSEREAGKERLNPTLFGRMAPRYYYLKQLRKQIESVARTYLNTDNKPLKLGDYGCGNKPYESIFQPYLQNYIGIDLAENKNADIVISPLGMIDMPDDYDHFYIWRRNILFSDFRRYFEAIPKHPIFSAGFAKKTKIRVFTPKTKASQNYISHTFCKKNPP